MTETNLPTAFPTRQAAAIEGRSRRGGVSGKLKAALDLMVWSGEKRADAAEKAGLADSSLRAALRKPHVLSHYSAELAALRTSLRARNVHRLDTIADDSKNDMAKVSALKALEAISDQADERSGPVAGQQQPGVEDGGIGLDRPVGPLGQQMSVTNLVAVEEVVSELVELAINPNG